VDASDHHELPDTHTHAISNQEATAPMTALTGVALLSQASSSKSLSASGSPVGSSVRWADMVAANAGGKAQAASIAPPRGGPTASTKRLAPTSKAGAVSASVPSAPSRGTTPLTALQSASQESASHADTDNGTQECASLPVPGTTPQACSTGIANLNATSAQATVAPACSSSANAMTAAGSSAYSEKAAPVKLWVSGIPTEDVRGREYRFSSVRGPEVKDVLNQCLKEHAPHISGEVVEVDRKDERKPFAFAQISDERTAMELVTMSRHKKVMLRGDRLILNLSNYNTARVGNLHTGMPATGGSRWHEERSDRGNRGKAGKGESGWASRDRGNGRGWRGPR